jgi:hypothetical protein
MTSSRSSFAAPSSRRETCVRTVSFQREPGSSITKVVRDHVEVVETDMTQFRLREVACEYGCGGPAVDESTAQIVGVLSGAGVPASNGESGAAIAAAGDIGTRADAFSCSSLKRWPKARPFRARA